MQLNDLKLRFLSAMAAGFLVLAMTVVGLVTTGSHSVHACEVGAADCDLDGGSELDDPSDDVGIDDPGE